VTIVNDNTALILVLQGHGLIFFYTTVHCAYTPWILGKHNWHTTSLVAQPCCTGLTVNFSHGFCADCWRQTQNHQQVWHTAGLCAASCFYAQLQVYQQQLVPLVNRASHGTWAVLLSNISVTTAQHCTCRFSVHDRLMSGYSWVWHQFCKLQEQCLCYTHSQRMICQKTEILVAKEKNLM